MFEPFICPFSINLSLIDSVTLLGMANECFRALRIPSHLFDGMYGISDCASSASVIDCMIILPGPVRVVTKSPSPPNIAVFIPPAAAMSYVTDSCQATALAVATLYFSPYFRSTMLKSPHAAMNAMPSPLSSCSTKPSPPKNTLPSFFWNAIFRSTVACDPR